MVFDEPRLDSHSDPIVACVEGLSHDGRGVARVDGKTVFIDGALPGEEIQFVRRRRRRTSDVGRLLKIERASPCRVQPRCTYFGTCGGCALQHLAREAQLTVKQETLFESLRRLGDVWPHRELAPLTAQSWGYRRRARLGVRLVPKKGGVLVGFREKRSSYVTPISHCDVLHPDVAKLLPEMQRLISDLSCPERIPQIEIAVGENGVALVLRHLVALRERDLSTLEHFAKQHNIRVHLQAGDLSSVKCLWPKASPELYYRVMDGSIKIEFRPTDFIQINGPLNATLVDQTLALLEPKPGETVLDLFCGLGNFSLPLATIAARVVGVEGDAALVERGRNNARINRLTNVNFLHDDLYAEGLQGAWLKSAYDKVLLDPPRSGAIEAVKRIGSLGARRVVYVSCNPATLARDSRVLVHRHGYRLQFAGIVDMFPHTHHVESIAVFDQ